MAYEFDLNKLDDDLLGLNNEEEALEDSYSPAIIPPTVPEFGNLGKIAPPETTIPTTMPGIQRVPSIPKPRDGGGIVPSEELLGFTNIAPEEFVGAPRATGIVPEDVTFEPARVRQVGEEPQVGLILPELGEVQEPTQLTADILNKIMTAEVNLFGETEETQRTAEDRLQPSFRQKVPVDKEPPRLEKPTFFEEVYRAPVRGILQVAEMAGGLAFLGGEALNIEALSKTGLKIMEGLRPTMEAYRSGVEGLGDIKGLKTGVQYVQNAVLENIPFMIASLGTGAIIKVALQKAIQKGVAKGVMNTVAHKASEKAVAEFLKKGLVTTPAGLAKLGEVAGKRAVGRITGGAGQTLASIGLESGIISADASRVGVDPVTLNLLWAIPAGFADSFVNWKFADRLGLMGKKITDATTKDGFEVGKKTWRKALRDFASGMKIEGPTEAMQEAMEQFGTGNYAVDMNLLNRMVNAGIQGGLAGGFMSTGIGIFESQDRVHIDENTGRPAKPFVIPDHAVFAINWKKFLDNLMTAKEPVKVAQLYDESGKPIGGPSGLTGLWRATFQQLEDAAFGRTLERRATLIEETRAAAWIDTVLNSDIREPADISKLPDEAQKAWAQFWEKTVGETAVEYGKSPEGVKKSWEEFRTMYYEAIGAHQVAAGQKPRPWFDKTYPELDPETYPEDIKVLYNKTVFGKIDQAWLEQHFGEVLDRLMFVEYGRGGDLKSFFNGGEVVDDQFIIETITGGGLGTFYDANAKDRDNPFKAMKYTDRNGKDYYGKDMIKVLMREIQEYLIVREAYLGDTSRRPELLPVPIPGGRGAPPGEIPVKIQGGPPAKRGDLEKTRRDLEQIGKLRTVLRNIREQRARGEAFDVESEEKTSYELKLLEDKMLRSKKDDYAEAFIDVPKHVIDAYRELGPEEFRKQATAMKYGQEGFLIAEKMADIDARLSKEAGEELGKGPAPKVKVYGRVEEKVKRPEEPPLPWTIPNYTHIAYAVGSNPDMTLNMAKITWSERKAVRKQIPENPIEGLRDGDKSQYLAEVVYAHIAKKTGKEIRTLTDQEVELYFRNNGAGFLDALEKPERQLPVKEDVEGSASPGRDITKPNLFYRDGEKNPGNILIRQSTANSNSGRTLLVQFSTNLINPASGSGTRDGAYYSKLYSGKRRGFDHPSDFWELPQWMGVASNSLDNADVYVVKDVGEAIAFLKESGYDKVAFSALEVNKKFVKEIAKGYNGQMVVGGYVDLTQEFSGFKNVKTYTSLPSFIKSEGKKYAVGTNYRHFQGSKVIPRLALSSGCRFKCSFCDVKPRGEVKKVSAREVQRQVDSIKELKPTLVYLNDKTFGQASNYKQIQDIYNDLKANNPNFEGFIIQTTATQLNRMSDDFLQKSGIKYVEIGIESFNDAILRKYRKPHRTQHVTEAFDRIRRNGLLAIPNIIVGIKEETVGTYQNTMAFLMGQKDIISHLNIYNLAVYPGTELQETIGPIEPGDMNENEARKSWMENPEMHSAFANRLFDFASAQLDIDEDTLQKRPTTPARPGVPSYYLPATVAVTPGGVSVYAQGMIHGQNLPPHILSDLIDAVIGYIDPTVGKNGGFVSITMQERRNAGEKIDPIPLEQIEELPVEGFLVEWVKKFGAGTYGRKRNETTNLQDTLKKMGEPDFELPPLQPTREEGVPEKTLDQKKLEEYYWKYGDEEVMGRIGELSRSLKDIGKSAGLFRVDFMDGHQELVEEISEYNAKKEAAKRHITSQVQKVTLVNSRPAGRRLVDYYERRPTRVRLSEMGKIIEDMTYELPQGAIEFRPVQSFNDLTEEEQRLPGITPRHKGFIVLREGQPALLYLVGDNHNNIKDVNTTIFHELVAHYGLERMMSPADLETLGKEVLRLYGESGMNHIYAAYGLNPTDPVHQHIAAMEKIAEISETLENPTLWQKFVVMIRRTARRLGFDVELSEDEIKVLLMRSRNLIMSGRAQTQEQVFNNEVRYGYADMGLPLGPLRIMGRAGTNISDTDAGENMQGWRAFYEAQKAKYLVGAEKYKGFTRKSAEGTWHDVGFVKDLGMSEAFASLPFWISEKFPAFKIITNVEWDRADRRNKDRLYLLRNPDGTSGDNPYAMLKDTSAVDKMVIWSDMNDIYLEDEKDLQTKAREVVGRKLSSQELVGYHAWKKAFDRAADYAIQKARQTITHLYEDKPWGFVIKNMIDGKQTPPEQLATLTPEQVKDLEMATNLTNIRLQKITEMEQKLKTLNFYAPHIRGNGEFAVRVYIQDNTKIDEKTGKPPEVIIWAERTNSLTEAEVIRQRLTRKFPDARVAKIQDTEITEFIFGGLKVPQMEMFLEETVSRLKQEQKVEPKAVDLLLNEVFSKIDELIMARGFKQHYIKRHRPNVIEGYQTAGLKQVFMDYMTGLAGSMTKMEASFEFHKALHKMAGERQKDLYQYSVRYVDDMLRNKDSLDRKLNGLKVIPYTWYLGMNLRLAATQGFQNLITAYPILARLQQENGVKGAAWLRLGKAMSDEATGNITGEEKQMLIQALEEGETMAMAIQEMKGRMQGGWVKKYSQKLIDTISLPFTWMEKFNRRTSLLAAYRMYKEAGKTSEEAYEGAKDFVRMAHYAYGFSNYPQLLRDGTPFSKIAGMAYVFKSFPHNYVLSMLHFAKTKEGKLALGVIMRSLAMIMLVGGMGALPFIDDIMEAYEKLTGHPVRSEVRSTLKKYGGDALSSVGMEGLPALAGVDMSGSVSLHLPIPGLNFDPGTFSMGVWGGLIDKGYKTLSFAVDGEFGRALESGLPTGGELMLKAIRQQKVGLRTAQEREILGAEGKPIMPTIPQTITQMAGFRPHAISEVQRERRTMQNILERHSKTRQEIRRDLRVASARGDITELDKIRKRIQTYNLSVMKYKGVIPRFEGIQETFKPETGYMKSRRLFQEEEEEE